MPVTQAPASSGTAGAVPSGGASRSVGAGLQQAAGVVAAGGLAAVQFLRSGAWVGEARTTFERDSRYADTEADQFEVGRQSAQAGVTLRNAQLVLGPRVLIGHVGLDLAVMRDAYLINGSASPGTGRIVGYDVGTTAVPDRRYSAGLFASRTQTVLPVLFGTSRDQFTAHRGVRANLKGPLLDSTLEWRWSKVEARARTGAGTLRDGEERTAFSFTGNRQGERQSLAVEHRQDDRRDLVYPDLSFPMRFSNLRHVWMFGESAKRQILSTSASATRRGGIQPADYQRGEMRLDYRFTPTLESRTAYRRDRVAAKAFGRDQHAVDMQLQHRLYESLVTTAAGRVLQDTFRSGDRRVRGGLLQLDYRKRLVAGGRLSASVGRRLDREDNRFSELEDVVIGEVHEARLGLPFRLQRDRVVPDSIVVIDATGTVVYREPLDYTVDYIGDFAEIRIQPDGRILDGRTVLVDYRVRVSPLSTVETRQPTYAIAVDYGWVNPYIQSTTIDRELVRGVDDGTVFGRRLRVEGVNLRWNPARTRIALRNERRTEDARNLAYEAFQFGQQVSVGLGGGRTMIANFDEARFDFTRPLRRETRLAGQLDFRWRITEALTLTATSSARTRRDTAGIDEALNQGSAEVTWERRLLYASLLVGRDWGERDGQRFGGLRVSVRATRTF